MEKRYEKNRAVHMCQYDRFENVLQSVLKGAGRLIIWSSN